MICFIALLIVTPHMSQNTRQAQFLVELKSKRKWFDLNSSARSFYVTVQRKSKGLKSDVTSHLLYDNQSSLWGWGPPGDNLVFRQISVYQLSAICIRLGRGVLWTLVLWQRCPCYFKENIPGSDNAMKTFCRDVRMFPRHGYNLKIQLSGLRQMIPNVSV